MSVFTKITEEDLKDIDKDFDSLSSPACHYEIQPEVQGTTSTSLISSLRSSIRSPALAAWSLGKSTSAQLLAREHGFVYYEADCFVHLKVYTDNPEDSLNIMEM